MVEYKDRLGWAMKEAGVKTQQLADALGISYQAVKKVLDGKSASFDAPNNAIAAKILKVRSDWLSIGEGDPGIFTSKSAETSAPIADNDSVQIHEYDSRGSMGHGYQLEEKQPGIIKSWTVDQEWLRLNVKHHTGVKNLCIVTGFGPSMRPRYNPGDPLLLDTGVTTIDQDGVYFFRVGEQGFIKQLQRIPTEAGLIIRAKSFNPDYDPFDITQKMDFEVFGKVLTIWKSEQV